MKDRYDGTRGKEAGRLKMREKAMEAEHSANNAFVKKHQAETAKLGMKEARMEQKYMEFDACMINDGKHAQSFARTLTAGLDKKAFPVK